MRPRGTEWVSMVGEASGVPISLLRTQRLERGEAGQESDMFSNIPIEGVKRRLPYMIILSWCKNLVPVALKSFKRRAQTMTVDENTDHNVSVLKSNEKSQIQNTKIL